jgi:hypothetical protein
VKKVTLMLASVLGLMALTVVTALPAAAASGYENYQCPLLTSEDGRFVWDCRGNWLAGTPKVRTFRTRVFELYDEVDGIRDTTVNMVQSIDGRKKLIGWRCKDAHLKLSAYRGWTQVGGGKANIYSWPTGFNPCFGVDVGVVADVWATYGKNTYFSRYDFNTLTSGEGRHYANPWRTA